MLVAGVLAGCGVTTSSTFISVASLVACDIPAASGVLGTSEGIGVDDVELITA